MIEVAGRKKMKGVELVVGDCEDLPFAENSFDAVICCESFHHYPDPQKFFDSVYRVLRPNGRLRKRLQKAYDITDLAVEGSMVYFSAVKR